MARRSGQFGSQYYGGYAPKHYLSQFLPKYKPQAELDAAAKAASYTDWKARLQVLKDWERNPDLPGVQPWKVVAGSDITKPQWVAERNPYYWEVDTAGNQLPYIDKIQWTLGENIEVINLRAIAGEFDQQERHLAVANLPVFIENQQKGNYTVHIDPGTNGGDANIYFNFSYNEDPEIQKWILNKDFRRALSMGTDRAQINEAFFLGLGTSGSPIPSPVMPEYPGDEWRTKWHTLDLAQANALLDKIGLDKKDASGMRLRTTRLLRIEVNTTNSFVNYSKIAEMIVAQWKKIGITLDIKDMERATWEQNRNANKQQICMWSNGGTELLYLYPIHALPVQENSQVGPLSPNGMGLRAPKASRPRTPISRSAWNCTRTRRRRSWTSATRSPRRSGRPMSTRCWQSAQSASRPPSLACALRATSWATSRPVTSTRSICARRPARGRRQSC